nr:TerC family protein [Sandaracinus amylolyticus]
MGSPLIWALFVAFIVAMLVLDLGVFSKKAHAITIREAAIWSGVWVALALGFCAFVFLHWGSELGQAFLTGYVLEKALSVDNLFVFYAIFTAFAVPPVHQHRLLTWGILGALVMRAAMIFGGTWLLAHVGWVVYVFGVVLVLSGARMLSRPNKEPHPERSRAYRLVRRIIPTTRADHGQKLFAIEDGVRKATPFFLVLLMIEATDVVFAVDSILAVFAVSDDPFIVFTSNIFAIMGMRSLYFVLAGMAERFHYLQPGLALVLVFVGVKMVVTDLVHIPVLASLAVITVLLAGSIIASMVRTRRARHTTEARPGAGTPSAA